MIRKLIRHGVFILNIAAAFMLAISLLTPYIAPGRLSIFPILGLGFPVLLIINILFVCYWIVFKSKRILLSLIIIAFITGKSFIEKKTIRNNEETSQKSHVGNFKLLTYNVRTFNVYKRSNDEFIPEKIFDMLRSENPDFAFFQEYYNNPVQYPMHDSLMRFQKFKYHHITYFDTKRKINYGIATYSKYPIIRKENITFDGTSNMFLCTDILFHGDTIRLLNCHLQSTRLSAKDREMIQKLSDIQEKASQEAVKGLLYRLSTAFQKRVQQAEALAEHIEDSPYPVICGGDMNDTPNSYTYQIINSLLTDSFRSKGRLLGYTYKELFFPLRIDYIFYSNRLRCNSINTISVKYSDHEPLIGEYTLLEK